nr:MAG TPA: KilA-N domain [Caudoviricetes sp.]
MTNLVINSQAISQHNDFYSLNDLHRVSGGENRHRPTFFLQNQETQEIIAELEKENTVAYHTKQGKQGGTYACRELVIRYGMWISPKFSLMVIRAFDALNTGAIPCLPPKSTAHDRTPLRQAVTALCGKLGVIHSEAYALVHQYMGVEHIDEISLDDLPRAVEYVHRLMMRQPAHGEENAFWRMVGVLEYRRISNELTELQESLDTVSRKLNRIVKTKGLLYDSLGEQRHPYHPDTKAQAQEFIDRQMVMKKQIGLI